MQDYKLTRSSPFRPGIRVNTNDFVGHEELIMDMIKRVNPLLEGEVVSYYIVGNRGMGKSSLSYYFSEILEKKFEIIPIHISNEGVSDLNTLIVQIIETLLNEISDKKWSKKILDFFGENVESVGFLNFSFKLKPKSDDYIESLVRHFDKFIKDILDSIEDSNGLLIIIDDVNGLSENPDFANWFRRIYHELTFKYNNEIPLAFIITSFPENLNQLQVHNESFSRLFNHFDLSYLSMEDVKKFYKNKFSSVEIGINDEVLDLISKYSYGMPLMMQEIGESIYWLCDESKYIDLSLALTGIKEANRRIYSKYLNPIVIDDNYTYILEIISDNITGDDMTSFDIIDFKDNLNNEEKTVLDIFLEIAIGNQVITKINQTNRFKFNNPLYAIYLKINKL